MEDLKLRVIEHNVMVGRAVSDHQWFVARAACSWSSCVQLRATSACLPTLRRATNSVCVCARARSLAEPQAVRVCVCVCV